MLKTCYDNQGVEDQLTVGKNYDVSDCSDLYYMLFNDKGRALEYFKRHFSIHSKQSPYSYLIEYYGLEEGKKYRASILETMFYIENCSIISERGHELFDAMSYKKLRDLFNGKATFTEIPQKKTVTLELTDEQLEQIKKIIE